MDAKREIIRMGTKIGAVLGGIAFLVFGIVPGFYFGSHGTLTVVRLLTGGPVEPTVAVRMAVAAGILLGIACIASASIAMGAVAGTTVGYVVESVTAPDGVRRISGDKTGAEAQ